MQMAARWQKNLTPWTSAGLAIVCLTSSTDCRGQVLDWMAARQPMVLARFSPMVYDLARARTVIFHLDAQLRPMTWELVGDRWVWRQTATNPPLRSYHAMTYDVARHRCVLFGGAGLTNLDLGDTWEFDGVDWVQRTSALSPPPLRSHAMAYDVMRQRTVLFGGQHGLAEQQATWEWDGGQWLLRNLAAAPLARASHAMCYDVQRQLTVMVGGRNNSNPLSDTWEYDGVAWSQRSTNSPTGFDRAMVYDFHRSRSVVFGGGNANASSEMWEWDGVAWTSRVTSLQPMPRLGHAMAYDFDRQRTVVGGGSGAWVQGVQSDTWSWDGTNWRQLQQLTESPRLGFWSASRQRVVGITGDASVVREWDGLSWLELPSVVSPPPRMNPGATFDSVRQRLVLFGGRTSTFTALDDTWEWDGVNWSQQNPTNRPAGRYDHAMAFDPNRQRTVLYSGGVMWGGIGLPETWEWDGASWVQPPTATSPGHRRGAAMAFDPIGGEVLLFGGTAGVAAYPRGTYSWNGQRWRQLTPASTPNGREAAGLAFDENLQRLVLGAGLAYLFSPYPVGVADGWQWDGSQWSPLVTPTPAPQSDEPLHLVYDPVHQLTHQLGDQHWVLGPLQRAAVQATGSGCGSGAGPVLTAAQPHLGSPACPVDLLRAPALAPTMLALSLQTQTVGLGGGCSLYLGGVAATLATTTNAHGCATAALTVPDHAAWRGLDFYAQAAVLDPGAPFGVALSQGLRLSVGD